VSSHEGRPMHPNEFLPSWAQDEQKHRPAQGSIEPVSPAILRHKLDMLKCNVQAQARRKPGKKKAGNQPANGV
jgi:hypothetical protein